MQDRKVREEMRSQDFYTGSLKPELHPVCQGNLSLTLHYFKRFTKYPPLHFQNMQKPHKRLLNHTRVTPAQQEPSCRPRKPPSTHTHKAWERSNLSGSTTQSTTNHFLQASNQAKGSKNWFKINLQLLQTVWSRRREFPDQFRTKNWSELLSFENHSFYSQSVTKFNRLIFKSISWFHLT